MNEWKKLDPSNLPSDILVGDYEFKIFNGFNWASIGFINDFNCLVGIVSACRKGVEYRYRKREHKTPSHAEIMTKWWEICDDVWIKIHSYNSQDGTYIIDATIPVRGKFGSDYDGIGRYFKAKWFTGRKSADIPPEKP